MSASNSDLVRLKAKQHPCVCFRCPEYRLKIIFLSLFLLVLWGLVRVLCQDVCMWNLCGSREVSKIDSDTRNSTVKRLAAMKTFPTTIEVTKFFNC